MEAQTNRVRKMLCHNHRKCTDIMLALQINIGNLPKNGLYSAILLYPQVCVSWFGKCRGIRHYQQVETKAAKKGGCFRTSIYNWLESDNRKTRESEQFLHDVHERPETRGTVWQRCEKH